MEAPGCGLLCKILFYHVIFKRRGAPGTRLVNCDRVYGRFVNIVDRFGFVVGRCGSFWIVPRFSNYDKKKHDQSRQKHDKITVTNMVQRTERALNENWGLPSK